MKYNYTMNSLLYLGLFFALCFQANTVWPTPVGTTTDEKSAAAISKDKVFYSQQANPQEWEKWFSGKKDYIQQTTKLFQEAAGIAKDQAKLVQQAVYSNDAQSIAELKKTSAQKISSIIKKLQTLSPPDELKGYHDKIVQSCQIMQSIIDAYGDGSSRYAAYTLSSVTLAMDAVKSLSQLYAQHGASQENMDGLFEVVMNSFFKDLNYRTQLKQTKTEE